jgi:predicted molibdopterin-dependent oxidoreductase YjgC
MTRHSKLDELYPEALLELNEVDAEQHGLKTGDVVRVSSRRGSVVLRARVSDQCNPGVVFIPMHFSEAAANLLTIDALDATAKIRDKACAVCIMPARRRADQCRGENREKMVRRSRQSRLGALAFDFDRSNLRISAALGRGDISGQKGMVFDVGQRCCDGDAESNYSCHPHTSPSRLGA